MPNDENQHKEWFLCYLSQSFSALLFIGLCLAYFVDLAVAKPPAVDCSSLEKAFQAAQYKPIYSYRKARKLLFTQLAPKLDEGKVTALYTGRQTPARKGKAPHGYNCEHLFPRAWMGSRKKREFKQIEADLHNLFPAEIEINSRRGHLPFGLVGRQISSRIGLDSKIGLDARGEEVIEPRPSIRGDIARTLLYMAFRWKRGLGATQELDRLQAWAKFDPPSQSEIQRNELIYQLQGNQNPFVACPNLFDEGIQHLSQSTPGLPPKDQAKANQNRQSSQEVNDADLRTQSTLESTALSYSWLDLQGRTWNSAQTVESMIPTPVGARRIPVQEKSFGAWLRGLPLLAVGSSVLFYDGDLKPNQDLHQAVIDIDIGDRDLQQCADAVMRFRAEYLWSRAQAKLKPFIPISFQYTTGDPIPYNRWLKGDRPKVNEYHKNGRKRWKVSWKKRAKSDRSYSQFRNYLNNIFRYAGTASLSQELSRRPLHDIRIGDLYLKGGFPGHAVIVVDLAEHPQHGLIMLLAQSYMPAQSPHILKNLEDSSISPWFKVPRKGQLLTPEWVFNATQLYRFKGKDQD